MGTGEIFLAMAAGSMTDPIALFVLLWPGLLHRTWWPRLIWAAAWAALVTVLLGVDGDIGALRPPAAFAGTLAYMSVLYGIRRLVEAARTGRSIAAKADQVDAGDV